MLRVSCVLATVAAAVTAYPDPCTFCGTDAAGKAHTFDVTSLSNKTFTLTESADA